METIKEYFRENRDFYIAVCIGLIGFILWCCLSRSGEDRRSTDVTVESIETESGRAADSIDRAGGEIENAEGSIGRAQDAVESGQRTAEEISGGISECQDLATRGRKLNLEIAEILRNVEEANRQGAHGAEKSPVAK